MKALQAVAIDGPAGAGKSTIARSIAERLGFLYVDTGAMYRAVILKAIRLKVEIEDAEAVGDVARSSVLCFDPTGTSILLDDEDVSGLIRTPEITRNVRFAAKALPVRACLVKQQQALSRERPVVMEGRDITTVVLPDARWRFFLTASPEERARRRCIEMTQAGHECDEATLVAEIAARDASDMAVGPMKAAMDNALSGGGIRLLDTTDMTPEEVINFIVQQIQEDR